MEQRVKQRLVGAVILVALGVIFIPMLLKGPVERDRVGVPVEIPPRPQVTPVPDVPQADALYEPAPGQQLAERPQPVSASTADSATEAERSSSVPADESRSSASALKPAIPARSAGEDEQTAAAVSGGNVPGSQTEASRREAAGETPTLAWAVQVGSFQDRDNAWALRQELRRAGFSTYIEQAQYEHKPLFRVRVGPVGGRGEAERLAARLHEARGIEGLVVGE